MTPEMNLQYFIPDGDDRVDPKYTFSTDTHQAGRNPYENDVYAHEIYTPPPYDGILVSRNMLDATKQKHDLVQQNGIRAYLRAPEGMPILGDCGAFSYWQLREPPYTTSEMLEYYKKFGFTYGVSIDHLIFTEIEDQRHERLSITQRNAQEFFEQHRTGGYHFKPIGAAQGWNEDSYADSVRKLIDVGYRYIALGGLVRSPASFILSVLNRIQPMLRATPELRIHLFGVTRVEHLDDFRRLGVTSFDSASRLRRAWMDGKRNYFVGKEIFTAIRIPFAREKLKSLLRTIKKLRDGCADDSHLRTPLDGVILSIDTALHQGVARAAAENNGYQHNGHLDEHLPPDSELVDLLARLRHPPEPDKPERVALLEELAQNVGLLTRVPEIFFQAEQRALTAVQGFGDRAEELEPTLSAIQGYGLLWGDAQQRADAYRQTLLRRPWMDCKCAICKPLGVEVAIFRGNNRNRRRGFHNTWHLYEDIKAARLRPLADPPMEQLALEFREQ